MVFVGVGPDTDRLALSRIPNGAPLRLCAHRRAVNSSAHHVSLTVRDFDSTFESCRDAFDLSIVPCFEVGGKEFVTVTSVDDASTCSTRLGGGDVRVELAEYNSVGTDVDESALNHPGVIHPGLSVGDAGAAVAQLPVDVETLGEPQTTETDMRVAFVRGPKGDLVEFLDV